MTVEVLENVDNIVLEVATIIEIGLAGPQGPPGPAGASPFVLSYAALRAVTTVGVTVQTVFYTVFRQISSLWTSSTWFLIAGTTADDGDTVLRPTDYNSSTNAKIWVKTDGL